MVTITDARKLELLEYFGSDGCITGESWEKAIDQSLAGNIQLYSTDMDWLYGNVGYCKTEPVVPPTSNQASVMINAGGLGANVYEGSIRVGATDLAFVVVAGDHTWVLKKTGYDTLTMDTETVAGGESYTYSVEMKQSGQEIPVVVGAPNLVLTGNAKPPTPVVLGSVNWFGLEVRNDGDAAWKGYLGFRLVDPTGVEFRYAGDATYTTKVDPGVTKYLWCSAVVPTTLVEGTMKYYALITQV